MSAENFTPPDFHDETDCFTDIEVQLDEPTAECLRGDSPAKETDNLSSMKDAVEARASELKIEHGGGAEQVDDAPLLWDGADVDDFDFYFKRIKDDGSPESFVFCVVDDLLKNNSFDSIKLSSVQSKIKKAFGITKAAQANIGKAPAKGQDNRTHLQLADDFIDDILAPSAKHHVACEGALWLYSEKNGVYEKYELSKVEIDTGRAFPGALMCRRGGDLKQISRLIYNVLEHPNFFNDAKYGLAAAETFYMISNGNIFEKTYSHRLRQRWKLDVEPDFNADAPLFFKYLNDSFREDKEQIDLLQEVFGALVTGMLKDLQAAVFLYGGGENGKSVLLRLLSCIFPKELRAAVKPDSFDKEYYRARLAGKIVNIVGDLDKTTPLKADFKDIVGCDTPISARLPYKEPFEFVPVCGHIFAANNLLQTRDHSHGFYRRWVCFHFRYKVPKDQRIDDLGGKIADRELGAVLAWALDGAARLLANEMKLSLSQAHHGIMGKWKVVRDSVDGFFHDDDWVEIDSDASTEKKAAFNAYCNWASWARLHSVGLQEFYERASQRFKEHKPPYRKRSYQGFRIKETGQWITY